MNNPYKSTIHHPTPKIIADPLYESAALRPAVLALVAPGCTLTYGDLDRLVTATAQRLRRLFGASGGRVGLYVPNGWRAVVLMLAAVRAGVVACPISTRVPLRGIAALLRVVSASVLITERRDLAGHVPDYVNVVPPEAVVLAPPEAVGEEANGAGEAGPQVAVDQPATVVFTSGSMGGAKAALHSVGNHVFSAKGANENMPLTPGDRWLLALPLYHVGGVGVVFRCVLAGATVVVLAPGLALGTAIRRHGITHVSLVAAQLRRLLGEEAGGAPAGLKAVLVGGSAVAPSLISEAHARAYPVFTTYGLTEMTSQVTTTPPGASLTRLGTAGRRLPYRRIRIAEDGEILVQGPVLFLGYLDGETLRRPHDADGWFHTGDRGALDADGYLQVLGRADAMFISGGENIHPEEIERALCALDGVQQAVVVPVADAVFGQRPVAFVKTADRLASPADYAARLEAVLPRFKIPLAFYAWPGEAASGAMKIDRAFFRRRAQEQYRR